MKNISYYLTIFLLLSLYSCSIDEANEVELDKDGKAICASVDDCLACYDFERARKLVDRSFGNAIEESEDTKNIIIAESKFWADKGDIDKALTVIDETWGLSDSYWPEADWQAWKYNIIDIGVATCCEKSEFKQAKIYALKAADDINVDGNKIGETGWEKADGQRSDDKAKGPSMREALLKKISEYEKLLK